MNRNYNILSGALLLLVSGTCFQSCQQDDFGDLQPDIETLVAEGRYLTARSVDASELASDTEEPRLFAVGTPYRLLAFTKKYDEKTSSDKSLAEKPRFNKVAWEGETSTGMRFINIDSEPDKWFGFSALDGEDNTGTDHLVSLDFYGFTYGKKAERPSDSDYIELDNLTGQTVPTDGSLKTLSHTETLFKTEDGNTELNDLMRGVLLNQNIKTAGKSDDGKTDNAYTQSIMPFKHCFSKLRFQISQQGDEENPDTDGNPTPSFNNLYVDSIKVTGTYSTGKVYLHDGKVELSGDPCVRNLPFKSGFSGHVTTKNTDVGDMIVFPSDGSALTGTTMGDGYNVGLSITVKSTKKKDIENMLVNTGSVDANGKAVIKKTTDEVGTTWYSGTIKKDKIIDYYDLTSTDTPLYFKQNTSYMLIITFQKGAVRIITVIPQVEEWLPGEGYADDPWQNQALGQPQMFDNIVWSDRNLGADHYDPLGGYFEETVGYFYQSGRNIPYYPYVVPDKGGTGPTFGYTNKLDQNLANGNSAYKNSVYRFYPIVDKQILNMRGSNWWCMYNYDQTGKTFGNNQPQYGNPQMMIPETMPTDSYFDFLCGANNLSDSGLKSDKQMIDNSRTPNQDMHWEKGQQNQPVSGAWIMPSSDQFLSVFPSTPHAGNITFRTGGWNSKPMEWNPNPMNEEIKVLRVTVPYYEMDMTSAARINNDKYVEAWNTLKNNKDPGSTTEGYEVGPGGKNNNPDYEPNGDPEDGYASVYVISRMDGDVVAPDILKEKDQAGKDWTIKSWGTIYAIKRIYTSKAYRMRWRVLSATNKAKNPCFYVEVCRYRCNSDSKLTVDNLSDYDWKHPAATIYFPICGLGDWTGEYINFGTECQYATSNAISDDGKTDAVQIKVTGNDAYNAYIAVVRGVINRNFGKQIRPIGGVNNSK